MEKMIVLSKVGWKLTSVTHAYNSGVLPYDVPSGNPSFRTQSCSLADKLNMPVHPNAMKVENRKTA